MKFCFLFLLSLSAFAASPSDHNALPLRAIASVQDCLELKNSLQELVKNENITVEEATLQYKEQGCGKLQLKN